MSYDITIIGHVVLDYIVRGSRVRGPFPGGPCVYGGLSARALGSSVAAVGKLGSDFGVRRLAWLRKNGLPIDHLIISDGTTTSFKIAYSKSGRTLQVCRRCEPFTAQDIESVPKSSALYLGGVLNELAPVLLVRLAKRGFMVAVDLQSYTRIVGPEGMIRMRKRWFDRSILDRLTILKMSQNESKSVVGERVTTQKLSRLGPDIVLVTKGPAGAMVWSRDEGTFRLQPYKSRAKDPTGAGDAFLSGFFLSWLRTNDIRWSAAIGASIASFVVSEFGPVCFGTRRQIEQRAARIHERIERV